MTNYDFLMDRILACPSYGFTQGNQLLDMVLRVAWRIESDLTEEEYNSIIKQADLCHIKMMEDNYNEGWS